MMRRFKQFLIGTLLLPVLLGGVPAGSFARETASAVPHPAASLPPENADAVTDQLIVRYKDEAKSSFSLRNTPNVTLVKRKGKTAVVKVAKDRLAQVAKQLQKDENVAFVEPNYLYKAAEAAPVDDPLYPKQWALPAVDAPAAWSKLAKWKQPKREQVIVAVADTGVDAGHPDLRTRVLSTGYNTIDDNTDTTDRYGHGTHVSGIIAAEADNRTGTAGVAGTENVKILPIKVLDDSGYGTSLSVAAGIDKAVELGADIINMSLGGQGKSRLVEEAINNATAKGVLVVAAAGNETDNAAGYYPAAFPETLTVASVNSRLKPSYFSNYGSPVDIAAPGENVLSTVPNEALYLPGSGTSMATPYVAGAAALVKLAHPDWSAQEIRAALENTAKDLDKPGFDASTGHGLVQVSAALSYRQHSPLQIVTPSQGTQVWGNVTFSLKVNTKAATHVQISTGKGTEIGKAPVRNGTAVYVWDSTRVSDGSQLLVLQAVSANGKPAGQAEYLQLIVKNKEAGVRIHALDQHGVPAYGAQLSLLRKVKGEWEDETEYYYETVYANYINDQGLAFIPQAALFKGETYVAVVRYIDDEPDSSAEKQYVMFQPLSGKAERITFDFRQTIPAEVSVRSQDGTAISDHTEYLFVPVWGGTELEDFTIYVEAGERPAVQVSLPPGEYVGYAVRGEKTGQNFFLRKPFTIGQDSKEIRFDLNETKAITFSLPDWIDHAYLYPEGDLPFYFSTVVTSGSPFLVTPFEWDRYWLDLIQKDGDKVWVYELRSFEPIDSTEDQTIEVPSPSIYVPDRTDEDDMHHSRLYRPGDWVFLDYEVRFGEELSLFDMGWLDASEYEELTGAYVLAKTRSGKGVKLAKRGNVLSVERNSYELLESTVGPKLILTAESGEEVWRGPGLYEFTVPHGERITNGLYGVTVDFAEVPIALSPKRQEVGKIAIERTNTSEVKMELSAPDGEQFYTAYVEVLDPKTYEEIDFDFFLLEGEEKRSILSFDQLVVGQPYLFRLSGYTLDNLPVYAERLIAVPAPEFQLDLSQSGSRMVKVDTSSLEDTFVELKKGDETLLEFGEEADYLWIDRGTYHLTAIKFRGREQYWYETDVKITPSTKKLEIRPDLSKLQEVAISGKGERNTTWLVGVGPGDSDYWNFTTFELERGSRLYLTPGHYQFVLAQVVNEGDVKAAYVLDAEPKRTKAGYEFEVDSKFTPRLKAEQSAYLPGETVYVEVNVKDRFDNQLTEIVVMAENPAEQIAAPLRLARDKQGRLVMQARNKTTREYEPISEQKVTPVVQLKKDGETILESKDITHWEGVRFQLPVNAEAGTYTLVWSVSYPGLREAKTSLKVKEAKIYTFKELLADDSRLLDKLLEEVSAEEILVVYEEELVGSLAELLEDEDEFEELLEEDAEHGYENIIAIVPGAKKR